MNDAAKPDPIDAAIAAADKPTVQMEQLNVTIGSTGRPLVIAFPTDMTEPELLEVVGWMATALRGHVNTNRAKTAGGRIIVPGPGGRLA